MNKVQILIEGYSKNNPDGSWQATSTTTLVTTEKGAKIIVDPGCDRELLLKNLDKAKVNLEEIDFVFLTHHHLDHTLNAALFYNSKIVDNEAIYNKSKAELVKGVIPNSDIEILQMPGHVEDNAVLKVPTEDGLVVVAADVFWWGAGEEQFLEYKLSELAGYESLVHRSDAFATDMEALKLSRKKILEIADFIIPGHGKMFKVKR